MPQIGGLATRKPAADDQKPSLLQCVRSRLVAHIAEVV